MGLPTLRDAVAEVEGLSIDRTLGAEEICTRGAAREDRLCERTMEAFCSFLGCVAGNLALTLGARGGLFIAGGIVPRLGEFFMQSAFREQFEAKGRYEEYLRAISTPLITAPNPGLQGLARAAVAP
jgi:glucokinase